MFFALVRILIGIAHRRIAHFQSLLHYSTIYGCSQSANIRKCPELPRVPNYPALPYVLRRILFTIEARTRRRRVCFAMFGRWFARKRPQPAALPDVEAVAHLKPIDQLERLYNTNLLPLERQVHYDYFHGPSLTRGDFTSKPIVLLVGEYSTGKTTFLRYVLGEEYPNMHIGPEPTTDKFTVVFHADTKTTYSGNVMSLDQDFRFCSLSWGPHAFDAAFLSNFEGSCLPNDLLKKVTFIDTPGITSASGERGYDYGEAILRLANLADMVILFFDKDKLDISVQYQEIISSLMTQRQNCAKIRLVLNKADTLIDNSELLKVNGALMLSLGKVIGTISTAPAEMMKVCVTSFLKDEELARVDIPEDQRRLIVKSRESLMSDICKLPHTATERKLSELIDRARSVKIHALISSHIRSKLPCSLCGHHRSRTTKKKVVSELQNIFEEISANHHLSLESFPSVELMGEKLMNFDFDQFCPLDKQKIEMVDKLVSRDTVKRLKDCITAERSAAAALARMGSAPDNDFPGGSSSTEACTSTGRPPVPTPAPPAHKRQRRK